MTGKNRDVMARPFSIRLTDEEKASLKERAAGTPLGVFVRGVLLGSKEQPRGGNHRAPVAHSDLLGRMLALLGQSAIAANLQLLARQAESGSLLLDDETIGRLRQACDAMLAMRLLLLHALGKIGPVQSEAPSGALSEAFTKQAGKP